jgi:lipid II:glycine glycyltransferase (peptidoglycan interpeptide bridge formation enzyme)
MTLQSDQDWDSFVREHPEAHLLQTVSWGRLKSAFGWEVARVAADQVGVQILFKSLWRGLNWAYIPKGPIGDDWELLWPLISEVCRQRKSVFLKLEPDIMDNDATGKLGVLRILKFRPSPHTIQPRRTLVVDLDGEDDDVLSRMKQKTRYNIRLAYRKGVRVSNSNDVGRFYALMKETGQRDQFGIHSLDYYQTAYRIHHPKGQCELFFAEYEGQLLAAVMVFVQGYRAYYFYGASSNQHRNLMAPYAVQWSAMRWARANGCVNYDLWGVPDYDFMYLEDEFINRNDGLWGVYRFKRGFGGGLNRTIGAWDFVFNPIFYLIYQIWVKKTQT